jgi:COP9 signalosome complex subunit 1
MEERSDKWIVEGPELEVAGVENNQKNVKDTRQQIDGTPSYDLDTVVAKYSGYGRIQRLVYIAERCCELRLVGLERAIEYVKADTKSVDLYESLRRSIVDANPWSVYATSDTEWIEGVKEDAAQTIAKLEATIKHHQPTAPPYQMAELIRDLAVHYESIDEIGQAQRQYRRYSDFCREDEMNLQALCRIGELSLRARNWSYGRTISKRFLAESSWPDGTNSALISRLGIIYGVSSLGMGEFEEAATTFLKISAPKAGDLDFLESGDLVSVGDVGVYTALCALAVFNRKHLRYLADNDVLFAAFTDEVPFVRKLVSFFLTVKFREFFTLWNEYVNDFKVDLYLGGQIDQLYSQIRENALAQYLSVFNAVSLDQMADAFCTDVTTFTKELAEFINKNNDEFRIDYRDRKVVLMEPDPCAVIYEKSEKLGREFLHDSSAILWSLLAMECEDGSS